MFPPPLQRGLKEESGKVWNEFGGREPEEQDVSHHDCESPFHTILGKFVILFKVSVLPRVNVLKRRADSSSFSPPPSTNQESFKKAAEEAKALTRKPDDAELSELYGLYKQATVGDVDIGESPPPPGFGRGVRNEVGQVVFETGRTRH